VLYALYGVYYGLAYGTARAMVADLVPAALRGTAYGTYNATLAILDLPASIIAGVLWQTVSPAAPFLFGAVLAVAAAVLFLVWRPAST
jgi:predicted MFS family arabinose efflux permease